MYDLEELLADLCEARKILVEKLNSKGFDAQQIYDILLTPYTDDVEQHVSMARAHYARTEYCLRRFDDEKCRPDEDSVQFWFYNNKLGVKSLPAYKLLGYDCVHDGEPLYNSPETLICSVILPALDLAVKLKNYEKAKTLSLLCRSMPQSNFPKAEKLKLACEI